MVLEKSHVQSHVCAGPGVPQFQSAGLVLRAITGAPEWAGGLLVLLAHALPLWQAAGYDVLLTSDHGMGRDRMHGGDEPSERRVPFVWMPRTDAPARLLDLPLPDSSLGLRDFVRLHRQRLGAQASA